MELFFKTSAIALMMIGLSILPLVFKKLHDFSRYSFLLGTGALVGICVFDLIPDVMELGGYSSLFLALAIWVAYSAYHWLQHRRHQVCDPHLEGHHHHAHGKTIGLFLASMALHCISSGIMLAVSVRFGMVFGRAVFLALVTHKAYESLIVSSVIIERVRSRSKALLCMMGYSLSLPVGVVIASLLNDQINNHLAVLATSVALGSLLGCMVFDFMLPAIKHVKKRGREAGWIVLGLLLTELLMKFQRI